jgi:hypothetical protein
MKKPWRASSAGQLTLEGLALRMRRSGWKAAEMVTVARPRPRGVPKNPR